MAACNSPKKLQRHVHNQILSPPSTSQLSFSRTNLLPSHRHLPVVIAECRLHSVLITSLDCRFCILNKLSITTLCSHLVNLEELKVVDCGLKELDQGITWPDRLKCIDFSRNQLIQCPQGISSLLYLQTLNLSGNLIRQLDPSLLRLPLLHSLYVLCNPIQNVPKHICRSGVFKLREYFDTNVLPLPQPSISLATTNPLPISDGLRNPPSVIDLGRCQDLRRLLLRQQGSFDSGYESSRRGRSTSGSSIETVDSDLTVPALCPLLQHFQLPEGYSHAVKTTLCQVFLPEDCVDDVKVEVVKDLSLHPDVRPNELLVTPVVQITPHGRTFTTEQPAIVVLPHCTKQGSGSGTRPHLVPVCSDSHLNQPTAWGKLDGDPSCEMFQDHIVFKTTHFSLFAVLAVLPYPSASKTISPDYGGLLIVPELPGFEVNLPPTLSDTLTVTATVYYDDAPYVIEDDGKTLASPCVGLEPHGAAFDAPVSISLPIPNYKEITAKFPNAKLELWYAPEEESEPSLCPKKWMPFVNISIEERSTGHVLVFTTDHFSWWETLWDIGRQALRKVGLLPAINDESRTRYISVRVQAFMSPPMKWGGRGDSDVQTFGLLVAVYKFGNPLSQLSNYPWSLLDTGTKRIFLQLGRLEVSIQGCFSAQEYEDPTSPLTRSSELIKFNGDDFCHRFEFALRVDPGCELREGLLMGKLYFKQWNGPTPRRQDYNLIIKVECWCVVYDRK